MASQTNGHGKQYQEVMQNLIAYEFPQDLWATQCHGTIEIIFIDLGLTWTFDRGRIQ